MGKKTTWWATAGCAVPVVLALLACEQGGANMNQKGVGNQPGGVQLGIGDIAVAPVGNYVLFTRDDKLAAGWVDTGQIQPLPVDSPSRLAFSHQRSVVYVGSESTGELDAVDVKAHSVLWHSPVDDASTLGLRLEASKDDHFVVAASGSGIQVFDAHTGHEQFRRSFDGGVEDVEILPDSSRVLVEEKQTWQAQTPTTRITLMGLATGATATIDVPNCASKVVVSADGKRAFVAPTHCSKDPVSVIDLSPGSEGYDKNLPGFGPVAMAPEGNLAVAFYDRDQGDPSLFDDPGQVPGPDTARYQLMLIDTGTLEYDFAEVGDELPRFAVTPDGNVLLVDSSWTGDTARIFDVPSRTFRPLSGPVVKLDNFALSSDSRHAYVLQNDVFDLDIDAAKASHFGLDFTPDNINISADDKFLFLRRSDREICIYDIAARACRQRFVTPLTR